MTDDQILIQVQRQTIASLIDQIINLQVQVTKLTDDLNKSKQLDQSAGTDQSQGTH